MRPRRPKCSAGVVVVVLALVYGLGVSCNGFREDEIECEQAIVHLRDCGPGFNASMVDCSYEDDVVSCEDRHVKSSTYPALSLDDSRCLQQRTCRDLIDNGACTRAQSAQRRVVPVNEAVADGAPRVCTP